MRLPLRTEAGPAWNGGQPQRTDTAVSTEIKEHDGYTLKEIKRGWRRNRCTGWDEARDQRPLRVLAEQNFVGCVRVCLFPVDIQLALTECCIQSAKTRLGADCGWDHELLIVEFRLKLKKVEKTSRPFRYDLNQIPYDYTVEVRNTFKGLDLIDRVPDELWMEVRDIVQETGIKTIPKKMKCKKAKWLSEEALQIAVKRREVKSKGEKESYSYLNAEFWRIARRDKKAFLCDQYIEIEENNRLGKTRNLFKKIRDTKGTFHAKMGSIKDRNGRDLREAEDIKKRWQ